MLPSIVRMQREGAFVWLDGGRQETSTTHVRNLVAAIELALHKGDGGKAYFVSDDGTRTIRSFLTALAQTQGVQLSNKSVPSALLRAASVVIEGLWRALAIRRAPPITRFAIAMLSSTVTVDDTRARRELGYVPEISVDEGLRAMTALNAG